MLTHLLIENFAIIEKCLLDWSSGMTVITGETGAGKSIILDALNFVLGTARGDAQVIRTGAQQSDIQAVFDIHAQPHLQSWLTKKKFSIDDNQECFLRRIVSLEGRSRSFINHHPVPLQHLRELGALLVTLHGQHEHQALLLQKTHRQWLDIYGHHETCLKQIREHYSAYKNLEKMLQAYQQKITQKNTRLDFLKYQIRELSEIDLENLTPEKIKLLEQHFKTLSDAHDNAQNYQVILDLLDHQVLFSLNKIKNLLPKENIFLSYIDNAQIQLQEALSSLNSYTENIEYYPEQIAETEKKLNQIYDLARKHHIKPELLPECYEKLKQELILLENLNSEIKTLEDNLSRIKADYMTVSQKLSESRQKAAKKMALEIDCFLHELGMPHAKFLIKLTPYDQAHQLTLYGLEAIEFLVSPNPGQAPAPLAKIASGGELSRISLAIDLIAAKDQKLPVLIFDEVDTGIGGATAVKVGKLLKQLSQQAQIICVTHLPQAASYGKQHLRIQKNINTAKNKTLTDIRYLTPQEKITEIARMLGGETLTEKALSHARELIERAF